MRQIFVDLDGVLADFYGALAKRFDIHIDQNTEGPLGMWDLIRRYPNFHGTLPLMLDAFDLWRGLLHYHPKPIILTGVPRSVPHAAQEKRAWVKLYFGPNVEVITCASTDKRKFGKLGDILIDDRLKYSHLWTEMGGDFIHHKNAKETLKELERFWSLV